MAATQQDIDNIANGLTDLQTQLTADDSALQAEIATLQAQGVDVTGLQAAASGLNDAVTNITALVPASGGDNPNP